MNVETSQEAHEEPTAQDEDQQPEDLAQDAELPEEPPPHFEPQNEVEQLTARLKRVAADFSNYQKRVQRDRARWGEDAVRGLLKGLLPVLDNLDQAIAAFDGDVKDAATYKQGVVLVRDELERALGNNKVARIEAEKGTPFDPDEHEAIMVQEVDGIDEKQISFVARAGYRLGETVLRPTQVGVAQPKPKPESE